MYMYIISFIKNPKCILKKVCNRSKHRSKVDTFPVFPAPGSLVPPVVPAVHTKTDRSDPTDIGEELLVGELG